MARYTLKTYCGNKRLELFEHRSADKLWSIINHPRHQSPEATDAWGQPLEHANRFEISDSMKMKLFEGNFAEAINFVSTLK